MEKTIPHIFARPLYLAKQAKASSVQAPLLAHVAEELADRLAIILHHFPRAAVIAPHPESFTAVLRASTKCGTVEEIAPPTGDALAFTGTYDAIFSLLDLHCVNDVPGYLAQCARALKPDGLFFCSFFAGDTLLELREAWLQAETAGGGASPRIAPMIGLREMGGLLQRAGLALPVADADRLTLRYADVLALLREIKTFGFSNPLAERRKSLTTPQLLAALSAAYPQAPDGRISATLELFWALAWKPHDSQQKPLKPGSASRRLEDVLKQLDNEK